MTWKARSNVWVMHGKQVCIYEPERETVTRGGEIGTASGQPTGRFLLWAVRPDGCNLMELHGEKARPVCYVLDALDDIRQARYTEIPAPRRPDKATAAALGYE